MRKTTVDRWLVLTNVTKLIQVRILSVVLKLKTMNIHIPQEEPKQETLEEAAERSCESITHPYCDREKSMFIKGAKWQAERMYSKEDMKQFAWQCVANFLSNRDNKIEMNLVEVIIDRNNSEFEKFKKK